MKILYDYQAFYIQKYGGVSRYFTNLYNGINTQSDHEASIALFYSDNFFANNAIPSSGYKWKQIKLKDKWSKIDKWNKTYTKRTLPFRKFDIFHPTYYDPYFVRLTKKPVVITVHDMIHEKFESYFPDAPIVTKQKKESLNRADAIIAISQSTYNDLVDIFSIDKSKIYMVYHGVDIGHLRSIPILSQRVHVHDNYILFVGERWTYKNFNNFVEALAPLLIIDPDLNLVCAGGRSFIPEEIILFQKLGIKDQCFQYTVDDVGLYDLYRRAVCFVFPSEYEGFGFPILEAFAAECPVLLSNTSCFFEVGGDAALYFNPYSVHEINTQLVKIIADDSLRTELRGKGLRRLELFPFKKCQTETLNVYNSVIQ